MKRMQREGNRLYKIAVVDDDEIVRKGIVNYIKKSSHGLEVIGEEEDGVQALELCRGNQPDIVITDVLMPRMNGIEFIKELRKLYPEVRVIIVSGHDEFEYAQSAMQLDVKDYLLKPFLPEKLDSVLQKVIENIEKQRNFFNNIKSMQSKLEESMPVLRERFYIDLVSNSLTMEEIQHRCDFLNVDLFADFYCVSVIKVNNRKACSPRDISREELIQFFLMDTVGQLFDRYIKTFVFSISDKQLGIIMCGCCKHKHQFFHGISKGLSKLIESMENYYGVLIHASAGKIYDNILKLPLSYSEAREAIAYGFAIEAGTVIHYDEIFLRRTQPCEKPSELLKEIILYTKIGYHNEAMEKVKAIFDYYRENCAMNPHFIKTDVIELVLAMQRYIEEAKGDYYFLYHQNISPYEQIQKADTLDELQDLLQRFVKLTIDEISKIKMGQSTNIIEKLKSITLENLDDETFNLDYAASKLYISPNYLRQLFKQHTGETFGEYLTRQRMKKAAELMADQSIKISEISEKVGFGSQSYFSKCFKKFFKSTPSEYREEVLNKMDHG